MKMAGSTSNVIIVAQAAAGDLQREAGLGVDDPDGVELVGLVGDGGVGSGGVVIGG